MNSHDSDDYMETPIGSRIQSALGIANSVNDVKKLLTLAVMLERLAETPKYLAANVINPAFNLLQDNLVLKLVNLLARKDLAKRHHLLYWKAARMLMNLIRFKLPYRHTIIHHVNSNRNAEEPSKMQHMLATENLKDDLVYLLMYLASPSLLNKAAPAGAAAKPPVAGGSSSGRGRSRRRLRCGRRHMSRRFAG
jgi:hypothetical protein